MTVSAEAVAPRILGSDRPLIATGGITAWQSILDERAPTYERLADLVLDTSRRPMSRVAEDVVAWVRRTAPSSARTDGRTDGRPSSPTTSDEGAP
ncbi:hypothetical protein [Curtobacterium sp. MCJR17_043]|uniref:hypothetical protein n=1 Tax=Curtobacterium sp. MCJR17_043 TaxID=2175660 RepID=UPI0032E9237C